MEFIVSLCTVETNAAAGSDMLGIVISLTRGVIILEITTQYGILLSDPVMYQTQGHTVYILF